MDMEIVASILQAARQQNGRRPQREYLYSRQVSLLLFFSSHLLFFFFLLACTTLYIHIYYYKFYKCSMGDKKP